jgi:3-hydroxyisobutyrate dehydrogenase-like beta-hydroxyacid dehydrogenase
MQLGFVGAGRIGRPMVRRLVAAGHVTRVFDRSDSVRAALAADGAVAVAGLVEVAAGADAVLVCVFSDEQVLRVCLGDGPDEGLIAAMDAGSVLVVHTAGSPRTTAALVQRAGPRGVRVVDAPISGGPQDVAAGTVTLLVGGEDDAVDAVLPALKAYGDPVLHLGRPGNGQSAKLINNAIFAASIGLLAHALDLGTQFGLEPGPLLTALQHGSSASRALDLMAGRGSATAFAASVGEFITKDVAVVRTVVGDLGADLGPFEAAYRAVSALIDPAAGRSS